MTHLRAPEGWIADGANEKGFVAYRHLQRQAESLDLDGFLAVYPAPALKVIDEDAGGSGVRNLLPKIDRGIQLLTERIEGVAVLAYLGKVAFVAKRPGNPFPHLVSIGRSKTNDISVAVDSVSKVHGYFAPNDRGGWSFADHGSTNGSRVGRQRVASGKKAVLDDGCTLKLGLEVQFRYLEPETLYRELRASL